jgi:hypothetical protein
MKGPVKPQQLIDQRDFDIQAVALDFDFGTHEPNVPWSRKRSLAEEYGTGAIPSRLSTPRSALIAAT